MKKIYLLLVFFGALLFCACEKENADFLLEDQVQTQMEDGALKGTRAHGKNHYVPFNATFTQEQTDLTGTFPVIYVVLEGEGIATHLGKTSLWVGQHWDFSDPTEPGEGAAKVIFTAANGDKLYAHLDAFNAVELDDYGNPVFAIVWGSGKFKGGTGRFVDAKGSYDLEAYYDFATGESGAHYFGEILY